MIYSRGETIKLKDYEVLAEEVGTKIDSNGIERIDLLVAVTREEYKALDPNGDGEVLLVKVITDGEDTLYRGEYGAYIMPEFIKD